MPLVAILKSLKNTQERSRSRDAVNLLVQLSRGTLPERKQVKTEGGKQRCRNDRPGISLDKLKQALRPMQYHTELNAQLYADARGEELSILLLLLGQ